MRETPSSFGSGTSRKLALAGLLGVVSAGALWVEQNQPQHVRMVFDEADLPPDTILSYDVYLADGITREELEKLHLSFTRFGMEFEQRELVSFPPNTQRPRMNITRLPEGGYKIVATSEGSSSVEGWNDETYVATATVDAKGIPQVQENGGLCIDETRTNSVIQNANVARKAVSKTLSK